jgi:predicted GNAT family acetyltransferase
MITASAQELESNELLFIEQHRSAVWNLEGGRMFVSSDRAVKTWNFLGAIRTADPATLIEDATEVFAAWEMTPCVKITPFTSSGVEALLTRSGWQEAVRLAHMIRPLDPIPVSDRVTVRECASSEDIREFSQLQSAGFGAPEWFSWVHPINRVNLPRRNQRFYIADFDGHPAGVLLLVHSGEVAGIYAVATLEELRGQGVARTLVARALDDAKTLGASTFCLNTLSGGPAQTAFRKMGFENVFDSVFYTTQRSTPRPA